MIEAPRRGGAVRRRGWARAVARGLLACGALVAGSACRARTGLRVVVSTDGSAELASGPSAPRRVVLRVYAGRDRAGRLVHDASYTLAPAGASTLPLEFNVVPAGDESADVRVEALAYAGSGGEPRFEATAVTAFRPGFFLTVPLELRGVCAGVRCPEAQTCGSDGVCRSNNLPAETLAPYEAPDAAAGPEGGRDAPIEALDAGPDARDGAPEDALDAGPRDALDEASDTRDAGDASLDATFDASDGAPEVGPTADTGATDAVSADAVSADVSTADVPTVDAGPRCPPSMVVVRGARPTAPAGVTGPWLRRWPALASNGRSLLLAWHEGLATESSTGAFSAAFVRPDGALVVAAPPSAVTEPLVVAPADARLHDLRAQPFGDGYVLTWARSRPSTPSAPIEVFSRVVRLVEDERGTHVVAEPECALPAAMLRSTVRTAVSPPGDGGEARLLVCGRTGASLEYFACRVYRFRAGACPASADEVTGAFAMYGGRILVDAAWSRTSGLGRFYVFARSMGGGAQACTFYSDTDEDSALTNIRCPTDALPSSAQFVGAAFVDAARADDGTAVPGGFRSASVFSGATGPALSARLATLVGGEPNLERRLALGAEQVPGGGSAAQPVALSLAPRANVLRAAWSNSVGNFTVALAPAGAGLVEPVGLGNGLHVALTPTALALPLGDGVAEFFALAAVEDGASTRVTLRYFPVEASCP